ncbi:hypothetical protein GGR57DRAFT_453488 [Xylariaceae sp. FL1272]|nr:hypothetical protein GGR57DRAFT_453488 [Xylariaceae sp. FL1272]
MSTAQQGAAHDAHSLLTSRTHNDAQLSSIGRAMPTAICLHFWSEVLNIRPSQGLWSSWSFTNTIRDIHFIMSIIDTASVFSQSRTLIPPKPVVLRRPSKYLRNPVAPYDNYGRLWKPPPSDWMLDTWTVTWSTQSNWHSAKNVRISFSPHQSRSGPNSPPGFQKAIRMNSTLQCENKDGTKTVEGVESPDPMVPGAWRWRGTGWKAIKARHWQVLGYGEAPPWSGYGQVRWMAVWFQATTTTNEAVEIWCDREDGLARDVYEDIISGLTSAHAPAMVYQIDTNMRQIAIDMPDETDDVTARVERGDR